MRDNSEIERQTHRVERNEERFGFVDLIRPAHDGRHAARGSAVLAGTTTRLTFDRSQTP